MSVTVSEADYHNAADQLLGWCTKCQDFTHESAEADAEKYPCPVCENRTVYGAEQALIHGFIDFG